jgi:hypothetical protein
MDAINARSINVQQLLDLHNWPRVSKIADLPRLPTIFVINGNDLVKNLTAILSQKENTVKWIQH